MEKSMKLKTVIGVLLLTLLSQGGWAQVADTDLTTAIKRGSWDIFMSALNRGASVNRTFMDGGQTKSPLSLAVEAQHKTMVTELINRGANLEVASGISMKSPLICAVITGNEDIFDYLVASGANVAAKGINGNNAMHYAAGVDGNPSPAMIRKLLRSGGRKLLESVNRDEDTPFMVAVRGRNGNAINAFLTSGFEVDKPDETGTPPILSAIKLGIALNYLETMLQMSPLPPAAIMDFNGRNANDYVKSYRGNNTSYLALLKKYQDLKE